MEALVAYLHFLSIIVIGGFLTAELVLCRPGITSAQVRMLPRIDVVFFVAALVALATGLLRVFLYGKGLKFYLPNPAFHAKLTLYVVIALISIKPTLSFIRWRRTGGVPGPLEIARMRRLIHVELALFALMPLMAVLMARGIGR